MDQEQKKQIAVFRFGVIAELVNGARLAHGEKQRLLRDKCARQWTMPFSKRTRIGRSTICDWIRRYEQSGGLLASLQPKERVDKGKSRSIDAETAANMICLRNQMPEAGIGVLTETMSRRQLISPGTHLHQSNVYRFLHQNNLMSAKQQPVTDRRKFEAELPNDIWQSDVMHGPMTMVDGRRRKTYLIAFIDDHSRLIPYARFYLSENLSCFLDAFEKALLKRGVPRKLYVDNGSAYRSRQLEHICASLALALIHATAYQPQGKGKIERFFRTVRTQMLPTISADLPLAGLNDHLDHWLHTYQQRRHSATGKSPLERFAANMQCLRPAPENLKDHFRIVARRSVAKDRSVTLDGRLFEAPVALIGKRIDLLYHKDQPQRVEARFKNKNYGYLRPVDLNLNCRVRRDKNCNTQISGPELNPRGGKIW